MTRAVNYRTNSRVGGPAGRAAGMIYDGRFSLIIACMLWVLVVFMIVPEGFDYADIGDTMPSAGSPLSRMTWLVLLGGGGLIVIWRFALARLLARELNPFLLLFMVLAAASVSWSIEPAVTIRRMIRMITILLDAFALGLVAWQPHRLQNVLRPILTLVLIGSIAFVLAEPRLAVESLKQAELVGAWKGLATQKNGLGSIAGIAFLFWFHAGLAKEANRWTVYFGAAVAAICLMGSRSSTSLMATSFAVCLLLMLLRSPPGLRRYMPYIIGLFLCALLVYSLAILQIIPGLEIILEPISAMTGKDLSFSGRTAIWQIVTAHIDLSPLLGSGYGAYWIGAVPSSPSYATERLLYFYPTEAHNGYLDIINDLGAVGGVCLVGYLVVFVKQALRLFVVERTQGALFLALIFEQLIANLSESRWLNVLCIEFVVMTLCTVAVARGLLEQRLQHHFGRRPETGADPRVDGRSV